MGYKRCLSWIWALGLAMLVFVMAAHSGCASAEDLTSSLTLMMRDDNKTVTSTTASSGSADISWETADIVSRVYRLEISGTFPANASAPQLSVKLAEGMRFAEDAADLSDLVTLVGSSRNALPQGYTISK